MKPGWCGLISDVYDGLPIRALLLLLLLVHPGGAFQEKTEQLVRAMRDGHITAVKELLEKRDASVDVTALLEEAARSHESLTPILLMLLIDYGADINKPRYEIGQDAVTGKAITVGFREWMEAFNNCRRPDIVRFLMAKSTPAPIVDWRKQVTKGRVVWQALADIKAIACRSASLGFPAIGLQYKYVTANAQFLMDQWKPANWQPSRYDEAIMAILSVLQRAEAMRITSLHSMNPAEAREFHSMLEVVHEAQVELEFLAKDCRQSKAGAGRLIPLEIRTFGFLSNAVVRNWQVLWKRVMFNSDDRVKYEVFDTLSSPAKIKLPPGRYVLILRKGEKVVGPIQAAFGASSERVAEGKLELLVPE